jgi:glycosyltransferase involved in cell wall biosynthesis
MARILFISLNYAPEETGIAPYSTGIAEHLASQGHPVTVLAGMPHYPAWRAAPAPEREMRNGVEIRRVRHYVPHTQTALRRALYEASSLRLANPARRVARPDAVIGVVPSLGAGLLARTIALRHRVPYGLIVQDLMAPAVAESGVGGGRGVQAVARAGERWAVQRASAIAIVAECFRPYLESLGADPARISRVRNWSRDTAPVVVRNEMRLLLGWPRDAVVCLHAGNMGHKQHLENIIEAAQLAATRDPSLLFVLMGDGNRRDAMEAEARVRSLCNLSLLPLQPEELYASILAAADVLIVNQRGSVRDMSLPSKLASYFAAGRPVVAAVAPDGETAREVTASGGGIVAEPDDPGALLDAIQRVSRDPVLAGQLGRNGRAWARDVLGRESALRDYEAFVSALLRERRGTAAMRRARTGALVEDDGAPVQGAAA